MKHMNKLTSAIRHRDNKYWVPSEGLNDASSGNCRIVILVPNECLKDSSRGKCKNNNNATVGRLSDIT